MRAMHYILCIVLIIFLVSVAKMLFDFLRISRRNVVRTDFLVITPDGKEHVVDHNSVDDVSYMVNVCLFDGSRIYMCYNNGSKRRIFVL